MNQLTVKEGSIRVMSNDKTVPDKPYPELPGVLDQLVAGVKNVLADNLVGIYLVGSLATGDFDLDSDIDFLVVTRDQLADAAVQSLQTMHARLHGLGCYPAEHLEGSYLTQELLNQADAVGVQSCWFLENGGTTLERSVHDNQWHVRWVLREKAITILGPDSASLLAPIPVEAMRAEVAATMRRIVDLFVLARRTAGLLEYQVRPTIRRVAVLPDVADTPYRDRAVQARRNEMGQTDLGPPMG